MSLRWVVIAIAVGGLGMASYGIWQQIANPPRVLSVGNVEVADPRGGDVKRMRLITRTVAVGKIVRSEIELPNGTWIDCGGDCPDAARKATIDFWDEQRKNKR
jgi:hypothetical protein